MGEISSSFEYGLNAAAKEYDGENKYIRITDIDDDSREFKQEDITSPDIDLSSAENYRLSEGDILFARTGASVGKSYIYKVSDGLVYYAGFLIRARIKSEYNAEFVFQNTFSGDYEKFIKVTSMRSGQPGVNAQEYSKYQIMVPSKPEQDKISDSFRSLDNLITLHQRKLFLNFAKRNDWEQRKLGEICQRVIRKNKNNESDLPLTIASQYGLIDQRDFFNKVVAAKDMSNYYLLRKGEFAYNKSYSNGFEYGSIKRLNAYEQGCLSTLYICFEITSDEVDSDYLECFFDTLKWYGDLSMICAEGARNHGLLNVDIKAFFADINVSTPTNLKEQRKIATYLNNLDHLITLHRRAYYNKKGGLTNVHNDNQQHYAIL